MGICFHPNWDSKKEDLRDSKFKNLYILYTVFIYFDVNVSVRPSFSLLLTENFQLFVPSTSEEPEVSLGSDLIIPCYLSPEISAVDLEIIWSNDTTCVCLYRQAADRRGFVQGQSETVHSQA